MRIKKELRKKVDMNNCEKHNEEFVEMWGEKQCESCFLEAMAPQTLEINPFIEDEDKLEKEVPVLSLQVLRYIDEKSQNRDVDKNVFRASASNLCPKRRQLQHEGMRGITTTPRKIINFLFCNITELVWQHYIREACVGPDKFYSEVDFGKEIGRFSVQGDDIIIYEQQTLKTRIDDLEITCHADGWGRRNSDGEWELIEIKSASNFGYDDFKKKGPLNYLNQAHTTMMSDKAGDLGAKEVRFFYLRKETGHPWDRAFLFDESIWKNVKDEIVKISRHEISVPPYSLIDYFPLESVDGKKKRVRSKVAKGKTAPFPCHGYCPYTEVCHGQYEVEWNVGQFGMYKPLYIFKGEP